MIRDLDERLWRKASASGTQGGSDCIELHPQDAIRDSKNPANVLKMPWAALVTAVKTDHLAR